MTRINWPLLMALVAGAIFWAALIIGLWNSAGCSSVTPC